MDAFTWKLISVFTAMLDNVAITIKRGKFPVLCRRGEKAGVSSRVVPLWKSLMGLYIFFFSSRWFIDKRFFWRINKVFLIFIDFKGMSLKCYLSLICIFFQICRVFNLSRFIISCNGAMLYDDLLNVHQFVFGGKRKKFNDRDQHDQNTKRGNCIKESIQHHNQPPKSVKNVSCKHCFTRSRIST